MKQFSLFSVDVPRKRSLVRPLDKPQAIFNVLSQIAVGTEVPVNVLIYDYENGNIPIWIVQEREVCGEIQILTLVDENTKDTNLMSEQQALACEVIIAPEKILAAPIYVWTPSAPKRRDQLGDIRQDARRLNDGGKRC